MIYYLHEYNIKNEKTANLKPREDCEKIFKELGFKPLPYITILKKIIVLMVF